MSNLKILYVDTDKQWRGGQEQLLSLMLGMKSRQHQTFLAAPSEAPLSRKAQEANIPMLPFQQRNDLSPSAFFRLFDIIRTRKFDIVHINSPRAILSGSIMSKLCAVPLRICSRRVNFPLKSWLSSLKYNWTGTKVVAVSKSISRTLIDSGVRPELVDVIYEGVDLKRIDNQPVPDFPCTKNGLIVGTVAHMSPEKGHHFLLEAAQTLIKEFPETLFVFVGTGFLMSELKNKARQLEIENNVFFTGFRSDSDAFTKNFDLFCLPSLSEGLSSAVLVAMANRLPVVATRVGGNPELVIDGKTGILVPPKESQRLAEALGQVLRYQELRETLGRNGRQRVQESFTLLQKLDATEEIYRKLLASAGIS